MAADTIVTGSKLTAIADALRARLGTQDAYTLDQIAEAIASIPSGADARLALAMIESRSSRGSGDPTADMYSYWAFDVGAEELVAAVGEPKLPQYPDPGDTYDTSKATNAIRPGCFAYSTGLRRVTLPDGIRISPTAFAGSRVESVTFLGEWTYVQPYRTLRSTWSNAFPFQGCARLAELDLSTCTNPSSWPTSYCLADCEALERVTLPSSGLTSLGSNFFYGCTALTQVTVPACVTSMGTSSQFSGCTALVEADVLGSPSICGSNYGSGSFAGCTALERLIVRGDSVASLSGQYLFKSGDAGWVPEALQGIYVPDDLVTSYQAATNWTAYAAHIKPLSDIDGT